MNNIQVLVVEDEPIIALDIQSRLLDLGFNADIADSGGAAISKVMDSPPDLVLMDIVLSGSIDGIQAAQEIHQQFDIPIVYLTAYSDERTLERAKATQPCAYLLKPLKDRELYATVQIATSKHQFEKSLRESEERHRILFESVPDPMWVFDIETLSFLAVNEAAIHQYGYSREEFLGMTLKDIRPESEVPALMTSLSDNITGIQSFGVFKHQLKNGEIINVEIVSHSIQFLGRRAEVILARNITERLQADAMRQRRLQQMAMRADISFALSHSNQRLQEVLQICTESIVAHLDAAFARLWTLNEKDNMLELQASAGIYTHLNGFHSRIPMGEKKIGFIAQERLPHITNDILHDPRLTDPSWAERERIVSFAGYPLLVGDKVDGVIAMFCRHQLSDDTMDALASTADLISQAIERKRTEEALQKSEEQLRQSQRLEAVGKLAGGVAHDFNNLLTAIIGYSDIALIELSEDSKLARGITEIKKAGERAANLTRQLLAFSRKQVLQPRIISLNRVITEMSKMLDRLIGEDIRLKANLDQNIGNVMADPGQIEQVLLNLAVNARDAMPAGGQITIETVNVYLQDDYAASHASSPRGPHVLLAFSDSGIGMTAETQSHIFEPFFTTKDPGKGTGLGLSTVYGIVKQSGGSIWVYSELNRGTTFKIYLPRVDKQAEELQSTSARTELPKGNETILLAEDDEIVRTITTEMLMRQGYRVLVAPNGGSALLICEKHPGTIHLVLTDVVMPELSGPELVERLNLVRPGMKILYMSGYADNAIVNNKLLTCDNSFIQKPFSPLALAIKVREVLDKQ